MTVPEILAKMIAYSNGNHHDINHLMKVHSFARMIGELEKVSAADQFILEVAAIVHDIACPLCREKYGNTNGKYQETEGGPLAGEFLKDTGMTKEQISRVQYLVAHHHTLTDINGVDYQILIEADYLVNADESRYSEDNIRNFGQTYFKTTAGRNLLTVMYGVKLS
jgi:HD superfamily phosphodiesterase